MPVMREKIQYIQRNKYLDDEFQGGFSHLRIIFLHCRFTTLVKYSRYAWSLFEANIG